MMETTTNQIIMAKICMIKLPPKRFADEIILKRLIPDIAKYDITWPVVLARKSPKHQYRVLDGLQRIIAMLRLGKMVIPAIVVKPIVTVHDFSDAY